MSTSLGDPHDPESPGTQTLFNWYLIMCESVKYQTFYQPSEISP